MQLLKLFLNGVSVIFYFLLLMVGFFTITSNTSLFGSYQSLLIRSGSMEPTIMTGDIILIKAMDQYVNNDVITFKEQGDRIVTHRIIKESSEKGDTVFITKGDANRSIDNNVVNPSSIMGKVMFVVPKLGFLATFVRTPFGLTVIILIPALLIIIDRIIKLNEPKQNTKNLYA